MNLCSHCRSRWVCCDEGLRISFESYGSTAKPCIDESKYITSYLIRPPHKSPLLQEILAGIAAAEVDKLVETKGLNWIDAHKAKKMAQKQAHHLAEQRYAGGTGWEYAMQQQGPAYEYNYNGGAPYGARGCQSYQYYSGGYGGYAPPQQGYYQPPYGAPPPQQGYYQGGGW